MKRDKKKSEPYIVKLPGFLIANEIGLGDIIKRATSVLGIRTCDGCEHRAVSLNKRIVFTSKNK